jgi:hypothetical protein
VKEGNMATKTIKVLMWICLILIYILIMVFITDSWAGDDSTLVCDTMQVKQSKTVLMCFGQDCYLNDYKELKKWSEGNDLFKLTPTPTPTYVPYDDLNKPKE